jgi:ABC-type transport system involved in multi-copper enzyme maturation permease subunit
MWSIVSLVFRKLTTRQAALILLLCLVGLGAIAFDPDVGVLEKSANAWERGRTAVAILACLAVIFFGGTQIALDIHEKTVLVWLTRPLPRWKFVVGKFIASFLIGCALLAIFGLGLAAMFAVRGMPPVGNWYFGLACEVLRVTILSALLTFLSSRLGYMSSALIGGVLALAGFAAFVLPIWAELAGWTPPGVVIWLIYLLIPAWQHFGFGMELDGSAGYVLWLIIYTLAFTCFYLILAVIFFRKRDLA